MNTLIKKQSGSAAIWFVFVAFAILGMGALGVEGSRYITEKAHLGDVMEATAIAVSESDDIRDDARFDKKQAQAIATAWVNYLVPDNKDSEFNVSREKKVYEKKLDSGTTVKRTIHHYKIDSTTTHDSWMYMKGVPSFDKQQKVYNKATAARVRTDFEPVDVVFVADYSGSMEDYNRIGQLKSAIKSVTTTIFNATQELKNKHKGEEINDSSFGFIPFSKRIVVKHNNEYYCSSLLLPPRDTSYEKVALSYDVSSYSSAWDKQAWLDRRKDYGYKDISVLRNYSYYGNETRKWMLNLPLDSNRYGVYRDQISYARTAREIQTGPELRLNNPLGFSSGLNFGAYCYGGTKPNYYNIERRELKTRQQVNAFNRELQSMKIGGGTDMYHGLLAAPQQFYEAKNKNRFIFVLSDGAENTDSFSQLVQNGLCENIRSALGVNTNGESVKFHMFVIGLKFNPSGGAYSKCFGKHIYEVRDLNKLKDVIMELLSTTTSYNVER